VYRTDETPSPNASHPKVLQNRILLIANTPFIIAEVILAAVLKDIINNSIIEAKYGTRQMME